MDLETSTYTRLIEWWEVILKHRWAILITTIVTVILAVFYSLLATPLYQSTATLMIERRSPDILNIQEFSQIDYSMMAYMDFFESQHQILSSDAIARRAGLRLNLARHPFYEDQKGKGGLRALLGKVRAMVPSIRKKTEAPALTREEIGMARVKAGLNVVPSRTSQLVGIHFSSPDPEMAASIANAVADAYIAYNLESSFTTSEAASEFLITQIGTLKAEVTRVEERLQSYGELKKIVSVDDSSNITIRALASIATRETESRTLMAYRKAALDSVLAMAPEAFPEVQSSALLVHLRERIVEVEAEIMILADRFHPEWPARAALQSKQDQLQIRLEQETAALVISIRSAAASKYEEARQQVLNLNKLLLDQEQQAQKLRRNAIQYAALKTEVDKKKETLRALIERQNEMALSSRLKDMDATSTNVRIVDRARPAREPYSPNILKNILSALFGGLFLGLGLTFLIDFLDNTIDNVQDLEKWTSLPVMAAIPVSLGKSKGTRPSSAKPAGPSELPPSIDLITTTEPMSAIAEAYRELRTAILLSGSGHPPRFITTTSAIPGEGKSCTILNIAIVLAQTGKKVLIVDSDLRRPRLHLALDKPNHRGISTFLSGLEPNTGSLIQSSGIENLDFMSSGPIPPNPSELLNGFAFETLLNDLKEDGYDHVLFDAPPVMAVADPIILANHVDATILVVQAGSTPKQAIRHSLDKFSKSGLHPIGTILNRVEISRRDYSRYSYTYHQDRTRGSGSA